MKICGKNFLFCNNIFLIKVLFILINIILFLFCFIDIMKIIIYLNNEIFN